MSADTDPCRPQHPSDEELFRKHYLTVERIVWARVPDARKEVVEDAVQHAFVELVGKPPAQRDRAVDWLVTVALNRVLRSFRRERRHEFLTDNPGAFQDQADAVDPFVRVDARLVLAATWRCLTLDQRSALTLWALGFTYHEIADLRGRSYWWAHEHIRAGLRGLRRCADAPPR